MKALRVGVIGVGHLGMHHARIYNELQDAELVGVVDTDVARAESVAAPLGVKAYGDIGTFLGETHPDAVSVVVPTSRHFEVAYSLMERGVHLLIEKPVTETVEEAEKLRRAAKENGVICQVGHIERFNSAVRHMRGLLNNPYFIQTTRMGPFSPRISDVGVVLDLMIHDVDMILSIVDSEPVAISALGRSVRTSHEDIASVQMSFANGAIAHMFASRVSEKKQRQLEIAQHGCFMTINYETQDMTVHRCEHHDSGELVEVTEHPIFPKTEPLKAELSYFVSCVREGRRPMVGLDEGKRALEICAAVLEQISARP